MDPVSDPKSCMRYIMPVHNVHCIPFPKKRILTILMTLIVNQLNGLMRMVLNMWMALMTLLKLSCLKHSKKFYILGVTMFLKQYWVSQKSREFEIIMHFLNDTVFVPAWLTWIDHIKQHQPCY